MSEDSNTKQNETPLTSEEMLRVNQEIDQRALNFYRDQSLRGRAILPANQVELEKKDSFLAGLALGFELSKERNPPSAYPQHEHSAADISLLESAMDAFAEMHPTHREYMELLTRFFSDLTWVGIDEESDSFIRDFRLWNHFQSWAFWKGNPWLPLQMPDNFSALVNEAAPDLMNHFHRGPSLKRKHTGWNHLKLIAQP